MASVWISVLLRAWNFNFRGVGCCPGNHGACTQCPRYGYMSPLSFPSPSSSSSSSGCRTLLATHFHELAQVALSQLTRAACYKLVAHKEENGNLVFTYKIAVSFLSHACLLHHHRDHICPPVCLSVAWLCQFITGYRCGRAGWTSKGCHPKGKGQTSHMIHGGLYVKYMYMHTYRSCWTNTNIVRPLPRGAVVRGDGLLMDSFVNLIQPTCTVLLIIAGGGV